MCTKGSPNKIVSVFIPVSGADPEGYVHVKDPSSGKRVPENGI